MFSILLQILSVGIAAAILTAIAVYHMKAAPARILVRTRKHEYPIFVKKNQS